MEVQVIEISLHRNGDNGAPFHAIRFRYKPMDALGNLEEFLGIVFQDERRVAVLSLDRIPTMGVTFARGNSWNAPDFEPFLRAVVDEHTKGTVSEGQGFTVKVASE